MPDFAVIVACGGLGKRFGADKAQQDLGAETLLARSIRLAQRYGTSLALAARSDRVPGSGDIPVLVDEQPDLGPVSALASGFAFAAREGLTHVLLLACDQPFLPGDLAERLDAAIGEAGVAIPVSNGRDQNMAALWRCDPAALETYIAGGGRSLWRFAETVGIARVDWGAEPADPFADIDDTQQLAAARMRLKEDHPRDRDSAS